MTSIIARLDRSGLQVLSSIYFSNLFARKAYVFKDIEHLVRLAVVMLIALLAFVILRTAIVPRSFGQYGHYRGDAIAEIAARPVAIAGNETCEACHTDVADLKKRGKHAGLACEACHGALAKHAEDPGSLTPALPDTGIICVRCHEANSAKPKWFPQVVSADHSAGLACNTCHKPHSPQIDTDAKAGGKH